MNDVQGPYGDSEETPKELQRHNRAINAPAAVLWLIAVLVAIHAVRQGIDPRLDRWVLFTFGFIPVRMSVPQVIFPGPWWTFLTHALLHADWVHLIINSVWMLAFGSVLARRLGSVRFVLISAAAAVAGAAANLAWHWGELTILIGASGAISGQLAGAVRLMFAEGGSLSTLGQQRFDRVQALGLAETFLTPGALMFLGVWFAITIFAGAVSFGAPGEAARIAWEAHVGGFLAGLALFGLFDRGPRG